MIYLFNGQVAKGSMASRAVKSALYLIGFGAAGYILMACFTPTDEQMRKVCRLESKRF